MIRMGMGIDHLDQFKVQLLQNTYVLVDMLQYGVDDHGFAAQAARDEIGVGAGLSIEKLSKQHPVSPRISAIFGHL